ncbi:unnamed protein product [Adineta steineri]|uniref:glutathione transferase n=1 Tax=Adineta steineri TaxID=433720 RepID=A0A818MZ02_9BILA|nr:unnamed protein product [Adineta steineri]CAF0847326.1 unnamed protein product [Adineta steineri]CAF0878450.1 unnamed protein product [Adineta steineri]CAF0889432.1 unnamed protein product [Adineta steineri]CAF0938918.1 unnamed protein product [Adineta steineri]
MSLYRLHYFNGRGRAEVSRLIMVAAGQKFEDIRYDPKEWSSKKSQMPLGQMPVLEFNGMKLPQSLPIARFLARQFRLAGRDNFEQAKVDSVVDTIYDASSKFTPIRWEKNESKKQEDMKKFFAEDLPKNLQNLELLGKLYGNGGPFFVGNHLTWADLYFYDIAENFLQVDKNILMNYPWLTHNRQEIEQQPNISDYLKTRPQTVF